MIRGNSVIRNPQMAFVPAWTYRETSAKLLELENTRRSEAPSIVQQAANRISSMNRFKSQNSILEWIQENAWWALLFGLPGLGGLLAHFAQWKPMELVGLTGVLAAAALTASGLLFWRSVRLVEADAALKQSMLQRGLTLDEMERLLALDSDPPPPPRTGELAIEDLAACLHQSGIKEPVIEQVFAAIRTAEPAIRESLCHAIQGLSGESGDEAVAKEILAAIRGLIGER
jgi:hypothetical protein